MVACRGNLILLGISWVVLSLWNVTGCLQSPLDLPFWENTMIPLMYVFGEPPLSVKWEVERTAAVGEGWGRSRGRTQQVRHFMWGHGLEQSTRKLRDKLKMKTQIVILRPCYRSEFCFRITYSHNCKQFTRELWGLWEKQSEHGLA